MQIRISNVLRIKDATPEVVKYIEDNLIVDNPEYAKKLRMGFWVGHTPKTVRLYEKEGDDFVLPYGCLYQLPYSAQLEADIVSEFVQPVYVDYKGSPINLYDYQEEAVKAMIYAGTGILQSRAGSGKTQMAIEIIKRLHRRTLWVTHTADLLKQSKSRAEQFIDPKLIGTITEGKVHIGSGITFATVQTLSKMDLTKYKDYWDVVIVDECHRLSGSPTKVTMFYKVLNSLAARHKYGLSATVHRSDGMIQATFAIIGGIAHIVPDSAVSSRVMQVGIKPIPTGLPISWDCQNTDGTINYAKLVNYITSDEERMNLVVSWLVAEEGRSCLILSDRLEHLNKMMRLLPADMRADAVMISGKMTTKRGRAEREQAIEDMRTGKKKYLFASYNLCKEGLDIPRLERLFLASPQKDYAVITQSIGRIARTFDGKAEPIAYDFIDRIGMMERMYKERCKTYRKDGCYWVNE